MSCFLRAHVFLRLYRTLRLLDEIRIVHGTDLAAGLSRIESWHISPLRLGNDLLVEQSLPAPWIFVPATPMLL